MNEVSSRATWNPYVVVIKAAVLLLLAIVVVPTIIELVLKKFLTGQSFSYVLLITEEVFDYSAMLLLCYLFTKKYLGENIFLTKYKLDGFLNGTLPWIAIGLIYSVLAQYSVIYLTLQFPGLHSEKTMDAILESPGLWNILLSVIFSVVSPAIFEEIFFRGFIFRMLE